MATNDVHRSLGQLSDVDLILETKRLAAREREATVEVIAALMELDERKLYLGQGCASLFAYCTEVLRFSEYAAYSRIEAAPAPRAIVVPLAPERYKMQITISREAHDTLRRAQDLLRHVIPSGDPAAIVERALSRLVEDLERRKLAAVRHPHQAGTVKPGSRHVPAAVRREVWTRDEGRCAFVGTEGRCTERGFLEFHHVIPFADGGTTDAVNLQLRCRAHNAFEADKWFGPMQVKETAAVFRTGSGPSVPVHF
jgi:hypothetical protein